MPDIFELSGLAVSRAATRALELGSLLWGTDHRRIGGFRRRSEESDLRAGFFNRAQNPNPVNSKIDARHSGSLPRVNARRFIRALNVLETCVSCRARGWTRNDGHSAETPDPSCSLYCSDPALGCRRARRLKQRPPAPPAKVAALGKAHKSQRRLRRRRAAADDGRAHQFRSASTHRRCCHR